jgi:hypothetical protein
MESIKRYFRNALIGLATMVLASLSKETNVEMDSTSDRYGNDDDFHMFI